VAGNVLTLGASIKHEVEALEECASLLTVSWTDAEKLQMMKYGDMELSPGNNGGEEQYRPAGS